MATVTGELKKWHAIQLEFQDTVTSYTETGTPNPFLDRRLNVTFSSPAAIGAGNFVVDKYYEIATLGTTNFTLIGASSNTVGVVFQATGVGSGTGTAKRSFIVPGYFAADGDAAETSATGGDIWHCKFSPDEEGLWTYDASFREGTNVAVTYPSALTDGTAGDFDGDNGSFTITASDKTGRDFRGKGRLEYDGTRYPKFAETGEYFIKGGPDSPENFLAFNEFDDVCTYAGTNYRKDYTDHIGDWVTGDPLWQTTKGKGIIGAINYLNTKGMNSVSFLTMNKFEGDARDVTMHVDNGCVGPIADYTHYDVSRTAQWEIVFSHAQKKGVFLHFKTQEQENAAQLGGSGAITGNTERKLYYRELIARFGHHLALNWNMGEENEGSAARSGLVSTSERIAQLAYVQDIDPYQHLRVVHSGGSNELQDAMYDPLLGGLSELTGVSMQVLPQNSNIRTQKWVDDSAAAGKQWVVSNDETASGTDGSQLQRERKLYGTYFAGGYGVEWYKSGDFSTQDYKEGFMPQSFDETKIAIDFMKTLPFTQMAGDNTKVSGSTRHLCFYQNNTVYAIYLYEGDNNPTVDINNTGDTYTVKWLDVRNGGALQDGTVTSVTSNGTPPSVGLAPNNTSLDWVVVLTNDDQGTVSVTGVTVSPASSTINIAGTVQLTELVSPLNATDQTGTWSTDTPGVATVSAGGLVTGVSAGSAIITFTTTDGSFTDTCAITVSSAAIGIFNKLRNTSIGGSKAGAIYIGSNKII